MESVACAEPGETLEEKLAALTFSHSDDCESFDPECNFCYRHRQQPQCRRQVLRPKRGGIPQVIDSSLPFRKTALTYTTDHPNGVVPASADIDLSVPQRGNPFDSPLDSPLSASPSSSDEELFNHALALQTPMVPAKKPPPPPPPPRSKAGDSSS